MRELATNLDARGSWGRTTGAKLLATTAVVVALTTAVTGPAESRPAPIDHRPVPGGAPAEVTQNCFMGQLHWLAGMGRQPQCTIAERVASQPAAVTAAGG